MSNKKQTAVDLIIEEIDKQQQSYILLAKGNKSLKKGVEAILTATTLLKMKCRQFKELEKQQIIEAWLQGFEDEGEYHGHTYLYGDKDLANKYYTETYEN